MLDRLRRFANSLLGAGVLGFIFFCVAALVTQFDNYLIVALGSYAGFVIGGIAGWAWE